jgi:hypothetical protein
MAASGLRPFLDTVWPLEAWRILRIGHPSGERYNLLRREARP